MFCSRDRHNLSNSKYNGNQPSGSLTAISTSTSVTYIVAHKLGTADSYRPSAGRITNPQITTNLYENMEIEMSRNAYHDGILSESAGTSECRRRRPSRGRRRFRRRA